MADYVSIIAKAIASLADNSAESRAVIYDKARATIERKLMALDPPPDEANFAAQMEQLEAAIGQVEDEQLLLTPSNEGLELGFIDDDPATKIDEPTSEIVCVLPATADDVILIDGIGEKTRQHLENEGAGKLSQIAAMSDADLAALTEKIGIPGFEITQEWKNQALAVLSGEPPRAKSGQELLEKILAVEVDREKVDADAAAEIDEKSAADIDVSPDHVSKTLKSSLPEDGIDEFQSQEHDTQSAKIASEASLLVDDAPPSQEGSASDSLTKNDLTTPAEETAIKTGEGNAATSLDQDVISEFKRLVEQEDGKVDNPQMEKATPLSEIGQNNRGDPSGALIANSIDDDMASVQAADPALDLDSAAVGTVEAPDYINDLGYDQPDVLYDSAILATSRKSNSRSSLFKSLGCLSVIALLGAGGWYFQDSIKEASSTALTAVTELIGENDTAATSQDEAPAEEPVQKDNARLSKDSTTIIEEPAPVVEPKVVRTVTPDEVKPPPPEPATQPEPSDSNPVEVLNDPNASGANSTDAGQNSTDATQPDNGSQASAAPTALLPAGETAFLYEEGGGATGSTKFGATVAWQIDRESLAAGLEPEAVIRATYDEPVSGLKLNLSIKRNIDASLPASHIIELIFIAPPGFSGGNIDQVSRFVMKPSEEATGESLIGVPARLDAGLFIIALNNLEQAQQSNLSLLENSAWIDLPITYLTGRRGLVTLSKGETGRQVFTEALADWRNR